MPWLKLAEWGLWVIGAVLLGTYAYVYIDRAVYQAYEDWAFERALAHRPAPVIGFLWDTLWTDPPTAPSPPRDRAADQVDENVRMISRPAPAVTEPESKRQTHILPAPLDADDPRLIGRLRIPRAGVQAMVRLGTDARTLRRAIGHIEGTALPGEAGNIGLAAHRDTFFAGLQNVRRRDRIELQTLNGKYGYVVDSIRVVEPSDVEVLESRPDERELTLVTCYPFDYVGSAPKRYIVRAREVDR